MEWPFRTSLRSRSCWRRRRPSTNKESQASSLRRTPRALRPRRRALCLVAVRNRDHRDRILAVPVLAGSAAFAVGEIHGWKTGLEYKPHQAGRFYGIIVAATFMGALLDWWNVNPIRRSSGVPYLMALRSSDHGRDDGRCFQTEHHGLVAERPLLLGFGWAATAVMTIASGAISPATAVDGSTCRKPAHYRCISVTGTCVSFSISAPRRPRPPPVSH